MKTVGIIGGIGPESTIEYYRKIISSYLKRQATGNYPQIIINSIDMTKMLDLIGNGEFEEVSRYLAAEVKKLEYAGAEFGVLASNTPHIVFNKVRELSQLPLISIVEATCKKILDIGLEKVALFGTKFTMQGGFYGEVLSRSGIEVIIPDEVDQRFIHEKYMGELVKGIVLDETRAGLISVIEKMKKKDNVQGLILGGTELPLILKPGDVSGVYVFDTTEIHVESIMEVLM
ncbi:MAG: amino acid racemase [Leptolyngbyaceae cyanobacterium MO_188.B28]|nr:amino acid racemase [Leptolyngbyaceae cyanobacterium MO_188.B28]